MVAGMPRETSTASTTFIGDEEADLLVETTRVETTTSRQRTTSNATATATSTLISSAANIVKLQQQYADVGVSNF